MDANSFLEYNYASARRNLAELLSSGFQKVSLSLTRAKSVLLSLHNADILTESEERAFIAALLLYSASTFLVPMSNSDRNNMDYRLICAVSHTINHQAVDWAAYTLSVISESATKFQNGQAETTTLSTITLTGCIALLNVSKTTKLVQLPKCK